MMFSATVDSAATTTTSAAQPLPPIPTDPTGINYGYLWAHDDDATTTKSSSSASFIAGSTKDMKRASEQGPKKGNGGEEANKKGYEAEYRQLERDELEDMLRGELPDFTSGQARCNERKNRYSNNLPLERTRVRLAPRPHTPGSDYINASYVRAPTAQSSCADVDVDADAEAGGAEYIAAQAPLAATCGDFWRMVVERGAGLVVMLTRLREGDRTKATRYWPRRVGCTTRYGQVRVRLVSVHSHYGPARDDLIVRRFLIRRVRVRSPQCPDPSSCQQHPADDVLDSYIDDDDAMASEESEVEGEESGESEWQEVVHLHYQAWPDFGRPETDSFRELLRLVDEHHAAAPLAPVITHCSAGLGRTGVLIAAHIGLAQLRLGVERPDVFATVRHIRKQRPGMVQTLEQFTFIHEVINALLAERDAARSDDAPTTITTSGTGTTAVARSGRTSTHAISRRCASSPPKINSRSSVVQRSAFAWSSSQHCSSSYLATSDHDLMDYEHATATEQEQPRQRGRQTLCSSTPAIYVRA
jgi:protein tyrosine phosphatase